MTRTLELPEAVYDAVIEAARRRGLAPADWIAAKLPRPKAVATEEERKAAMERLLSHTFSLGRPTGTDNEAIDADLAREYGDSHEPS